MGSNGSPGLERALLNQVPEKEFFKIGEVAALAQVEAYVLRYWEREFPFLQPEKSASGQRLYRREDVETVLAIKKLLYEQGFTIAGARRQLGGGNGHEQPPAAPAASTPALLSSNGERAGVAAAGDRKSKMGAEELGAIRRELADLLTLLSRR